MHNASNNASEPSAGLVGANYLLLCASERSKGCYRHNISTQGSPTADSLLWCSGLSKLHLQSLRSPKQVAQRYSPLLPCTLRGWPANMVHPCWDRPRSSGDCGPAAPSRPCLVSISSPLAALAALRGDLCLWVIRGNADS